MRTEEASPTFTESKHAAFENFESCNTQTLK